MIDTRFIGYTQPVTFWEVEKGRLRAFAVQIAEVGNAQFKKGDFERLGLVCPPRLMREIREHLTDGARGAIHFEVPKDLTKYGNHQLREWLPNPQFV